MIKQCVICKKKFITYPSKIELKRGKFCSKQCNNVFQSKSRKGKYPKSLRNFHKNNPDFRHYKKTSTFKKKVSLAIKNLWKNEKYRNQMRKAHRKKISKRGNYLKIYSPNHPRIDKRGYIYQHIIIMEKKIGRYLKLGEIVHHIDGNRYNNHPNNLMLFKKNGLHLNFHLKNKIKSFAKLV